MIRKLQTFPRVAEACGKRSRNRLKFSRALGIADMTHREDRWSCDRGSRDAARSDGALRFGNYYMMDYELMGGDARAAIIAESAKLGTKPRCRSARSSGRCGSRPAQDRPPSLSFRNAPRRGARLVCLACLLRRYEQRGFNHAGRSALSCCRQRRFDESSPPPNFSFDNVTKISYKKRTIDKCI